MYYLITSPHLPPLQSLFTIALKSRSFSMGKHHLDSPERNASIERNMTKKPKIISQGVNKVNGTLDDSRQDHSANSGNYSPSVAELEELDHIMNNLGYHSELLIQRFSWLKDTDLDAPTSPAAGRYMKSFRIRLAALLVKQHAKEGIPLIDNLISARKDPLRNSGLTCLEGDINPERAKDLQSHILSTVSDSLKQLQHRAEGDAAFFADADSLVSRSKDDGRVSKRGAQQKEKKAAQQEQEEEPWPPALPEITDQALMDQVFTHKSVLSDAELKTREDWVNMSNERLEYKGDSLLEFIISDKLFNEFPNDTEGDLTQKKATLVCNDTLFDLAIAYGMHEKLKISSDLRRRAFKSPLDTVPDASNKNKAYADVFEAYIAGVSLDQGLSVVRDWLLKVYKPFIEELKSQKPKIEINRNAKNELYRKVGSAEQVITYQTLDNQSPFTVACLINGEEVSRGTDRSIKLAGLRAADKVLQNNDLVEHYASLRRSTPKTAPTTVAKFKAS